VRDLLAVLELVADRIGMLVVYEPSVDDDPDLPGVVERVRALVNAGRDDEPAVTLLVERSGVPPDAIDAVRELARWPIVLRGVRVLPRERAAIAGHRLRRRGRLTKPRAVARARDHAAQLTSVTVRAPRASDAQSPRRVCASSHRWLTGEDVLATAMIGSRRAETDPSRARRHTADYIVLTPWRPQATERLALMTCETREHGRHHAGGLRSTSVRTARCSMSQPYRLRTKGGRSRE